jgi:hypothetical protein
MVTNGGHASRTGGSSRRAKAHRMAGSRATRTRQSRGGCPGMKSFCRSRKKTPFDIRVRSVRQQIPSRDR